MGVFWLKNDKGLLRCDPLSVIRVHSKRHGVHKLQGLVLHIVIEELGFELVGNMSKKSDFMGQLPVFIQTM